MPDHLPGLAAKARVLPLLFAGALLAGCSNSPYPTGETAQPVLYRAMSDDPRSLDPSFAYTVTESRIVDLIYPAYFQYHYLKRPVELELCLGAEEPKREAFTYTENEKGKTVQKKGERWTFRIKKGLRFQDDPCFPGGKGREITAKDFLYSFRRIQDPSVHSPVQGFFLDKILGIKEYADAQVKRQEAKQPIDLQAPVRGLVENPNDPYTFQILLNQPFPQLRYLMAMHFTTPIPHEAVAKYGAEFARHPVGSGPYMLTEYTKRQRIVLEKNPNRREEFYPSEGTAEDREKGRLSAAGTPLPIIEKVVFTTVREAITGWNLFLQGYLDSYAVTQDNFQQAMAQSGQLSPEMKDRGVYLDFSADPNLYYYAFNMEDPVWGGYTERAKKLRQAVSLSVDAQAFIDLFQFGSGKQAQWLLPEGLFGYDPNYKNPYRQVDIDRAKKLLAEAGYPNGIDPKTGKRLVLTYDNYHITPTGRQMVGVLQRQIERIGITLESKSWRPPVWQDRVDEGKFQFVDYGWLADYPDPENFLFLLYGPNKRPGPNHANYNNPEYNKLFEQMRSMDDGPERLALINKMREISVEDAAWIYRQHDQDMFLNQKWLGNYKPHPVANDGAKYYSINGTERAALQAQWNQPNWWPALGALAFVLVGSIPAAAAVRARSRRRVRIQTPEQGA